MPVYHFDDAAVAPIRAHGGSGHIFAARVFDSAGASAINFIDQVTIPPGSTIGEHRHSVGDEEVYVIIAGTGAMFIDRAIYTVTAGDVVVNVPGGSHGLRNSGPGDLCIVVIDVAADAAHFVLPEDLPKD